MGISRRKHKQIKKRTKRKVRYGGKISTPLVSSLEKKSILPQEQLDKKQLKDKLDDKLQQELITQPGIITDLKVLKSGLKECKDLIEELYHKFSPIQFNEDNVIAQYICSGTEYATDSSCEGLRYLEQQHCSNKKNIIGELACANLDVIINNVCNKIDVRNNLCKDVKKIDVQKDFIKNLKNKGTYLSKLGDAKFQELRQKSQKAKQLIESKFKKEQIKNN